MPLRSSRRPDALEKGLRLGCGALIGAFCGALVGGMLWREFRSTTTIVVVGAIVTVLAAWASLRYGDRFWDAFAGARRRVWPW
jgi:hypothetical protein